MFRCTPLTPEKAFRLEKKCKEAIIKLSAFLEDSTGSGITAISNALIYAEDWKCNVDDSLYIMKMEPRAEFIDGDSTQAKELKVCYHALYNIWSDLCDLHKNRGFVNVYDELKEKRISPKYFTQSIKNRKIPPQYWCFAYKCEECSKGQILDQLKQSRYCNEITDIEIVNAFLPENPLLPPDPSYNTGYSICGRVNFENGATRNILKELFPGATIYIGKNAHIFYEQYVKEYYGPTYSLYNPDL